MRKFLILTVAALAVVNVDAQVGTVRVKTWADDKKAAFSFTFDDSYISHYETVRPILNSFGFKGTFYIISGYINETLPGVWRYGTWEQFREMAAEGHEMGAHTVTHPDLTTLAEGTNTTENTIRYEMYQSKKTIEEEIGVDVLTMAYPYTEFNSQVKNLADKYYEAARAGGSGLNPAVLSTSDRLELYSKKVEFSLPRNSLQDDKDELQNYKTYIQNSVTQGKWATMMVHEVYPFSRLAWALNQGSYYPMTAEWLTEFCEYMKQQSDSKNVWVETVANILKYSRERETFTSAVITKNDSLIEIKPSDAMDNALYNYPLTADVVVPSAWDTVYVSYNGSEKKYVPFTSGSEKIIRLYIVPDEGNIILRKKTAVPAPVDKYNIAGTVVYNNTEQSPMQNINVVLSGGHTPDSTATAADGKFIFSNKPVGNYSMNFSASAGIKGVTATDALAAVLYFTGDMELDSLQKYAADVTADGKINSTDALQILRRVSGMIDSFAAPDWIFLPAQVNLKLTASSEANMIKVISSGDVNASYKP